MVIGGEYHEGVVVTYTAGTRQLQAYVKYGEWDNTVLTFLCGIDGAVVVQ